MANAYIYIAGVYTTRRVHRCRRIARNKPNRDFGTDETASSANVLGLLYNRHGYCRMLLDGGAIILSKEKLIRPDLLFIPPYIFHFLRFMSFIIYIVIS